MDDINGYAVSSNEFNGPPSPQLQVFDEYKDDMKWGQDAAHYVAAMSDNGRQVVHVQVVFKFNPLVHMSYSYILYLLGIVFERS